MTTVIEELEEADTRSAYQKKLDKLNAKNNVKKIKEIWNGLNTYFLSLHKKVTSLRSTKWNSDDVEITWTNKYDEGRLKYPNLNSYNHIYNLQLRKKDKVSEMEFVPFVKENFVFQIDTTKSSVKKGVFNHWIDNPPEGYAVVTSTAIDNQIRVHISLIDTDLISANFKERVKIYALVNALSYTRDTASGLWGTFRDKTMQLSEEIKNELDPQKHHCNLRKVSIYSEAITKLSHNLILLREIWNLSNKFLSKIEDTAQYNREQKKYWEKPAVLFSVQDFYKEISYSIAKIEQGCSAYWDWKDRSNHHTHRNDLDYVGILDWKIDHSVFTDRKVRKISDKLHIVGTLSAFQEYITQVLIWGGDETNFSDAVATSFIDESWEMPNKY